MYITLVRNSKIRNYFWLCTKRTQQTEVRTLGISNQNLWNVPPCSIVCSSVDSLAETPRDIGVGPSELLWLRCRMLFTHNLACSTYSPELPYSDSVQYIITSVRSQWSSSNVLEGNMRVSASESHHGQFVFITVAAAWAEHLYSIAEINQVFHLPQKNKISNFWILSGTNWVSRHQKGKTRKVNQSGFTGARDSEWQWHLLSDMQICTSPRQITTRTSHHSFFYRSDALPAAKPTASGHWRHLKT